MIAALWILFILAFLFFALGRWVSASSTGGDGFGAGIEVLLCWGLSAALALAGFVVLAVKSFR